MQTAVSKLLAAGLIAAAAAGSVIVLRSTARDMAEGKPATRPPRSPKPATKVPEVHFIKPQNVRGIYLTAWSAGARKKMNNVLALLDRTELNAVVIDIRDAGYVYWKTGIELADKSGATRIAVLDPSALMKLLEKRGVYPIARIACFRDRAVPKKFPDLAVLTPTGKLWKDRAGYTWLDPYNRKNWAYLAEIVDFALDLGFPEIQLDYVRFPSEGDRGTMVFPARRRFARGKVQQTDVIREFAEFIRGRVKARGGVLSADIFGIVSSSRSDQGIGQELEKISGPFDLICPMVYPSHYARGEYGIADPNSSPYAIVKKSLKDFAERLPGKKMRPWLQDFSLGVRYGKTQVESQIRAARELGYNEYLLWNAGNRYTEAAIKDTSHVLAPVKGRPPMNRAPITP